MEAIAILVILGIFYWGIRGLYFLYNVIGGFMVALCVGIFVTVRHIYISKRYKSSRKT